jgi:hypothetical protein
MSQIAASEPARDPGSSIGALMAYENERLLLRYMEDFGADRRTAEARFHGFKQFIAVCGTMDGDIVTSDTIDGVWHTFLLFTREYERFCHAHVGEYLHHEPFETPKPHAYVATRACAQRLFGPLDASLWPVTAKGRCSSGACRGDRPGS